MKTFALVDCNNFYCSCERLFRPDLKCSPMVVLSNNDGCIVSRSAEVKALGIPMASPLFKVTDQLARHDVQVFSSNYTLYGDISQRVMQTLEGFTPNIEIYSIDEAFLDLSGMDDLVGYGQQIRRTVHKHVGVPVSIGIAPTKTLAKLANWAAKKFPQTQGVVDLSDPKRQRRLLEIAPVHEVWGVGRQHAKRLKGWGVTTAAQLADMRTSTVRQLFSVVMERTLRELNGESCIDLEAQSVPRKQIVCSRSFGTKLTEFNAVREAVCEFAARAAEKLRQGQQRTAAVTVFIRTSPFSPTQPYYSDTATATLHQPSSNTRDILGLVDRLLGDIWKEGFQYMKAGVMLGELCAEDQFQCGLFNTVPTEDEDRLMAVIDQVNRSGQGKIWFGGQRPQKDWFMRQAHVSPAYTTCWDNLPKVV